MASREDLSDALVRNGQVSAKLSEVLTHNAALDAANAELQNKNEILRNDIKFDHDAIVRQRDLLIRYREVFEFAKSLAGIVALLNQRDAQHSFFTRARCILKSETWKAALDFARIVTRKTAEIEIDLANGAYNRFSTAHEKK